MTPGDPCSECGQPTDPARDGVYDGVVCLDCCKRMDAEHAAWEAALSPEDRADLNEQCDRAFREKVLPVLESRRLAASRFTPECNQFVARKLHEKGVEMTPDQVAEARDSGLAKIRVALREKGWDVPDDGVGLMMVLQDVWRKGKAEAEEAP